jgi:hypothetical protein
MKCLIELDEVRTHTLVAVGVAIGLAISLGLVLVSSATQLAEQSILESKVRIGESARR